jgi:hypothetical protein
MIQHSTAMKTALKRVGIALALLVAFVVVERWMGVSDHRRSMIFYLIMTLAVALIGLFFLKEWIKEFGSEFGSNLFRWSDLFQLLLIETFVLFFCAFCLSRLFGW